MKIAILAFIAAALVSESAFAQSKFEPHDVYGLYMLESGTVIVRVKDCGDATPCGRVVWFNAKGLPGGETMKTFKSGNGELVLGSTMLQGFTKKKSAWKGGTIYDGENDKTYKSKIKRLDDGTLEVKGCVGPICQAQIWTRIED